jgi:hypothetical protein
MEQQSILGAWRLISIYAKADDGDVFKPYGDDPSGILIYTADGNMAAVLMRQGRPNFESADPLNGSPAELKAAFEGFDAYCGTFDLDIAKGTVIHHVDAARFPNWVGSDQLRHFQLEGDSLRISSAPMHSMGKDWVIHVVWDRSGRGRPDAMA